MRNGSPKCILKNNKGQAVLEYLLLTLIVVVIAMTVIKEIAVSTETYAANYFGKYLECLLEVGELPTLGGDDSIVTGCESEFQPFTLASGRPPINPEETGGSSGSDSENANGSDSKTNDQNNSSTAVADSSGSSDSGSSGGLNSKTFNGRPSRVPLSQADKGSTKSASNDSGAGGLNNFEQDDEFGDDGTGRSEYIPISGGNLEEKEKETDVKSIKGNVEQNPEQELRGRRVPATAQKSKDSDVKPDEGMSLPNFIKYLVIAAIILIIIIFFGGQVMQFQKSKD